MGIGTRRSLDSLHTRDLRVADDEFASTTCQAGHPSSFDLGYRRLATLHVARLLMLRLTRDKRLSGVNEQNLLYFAMLTEYRSWGYLIASIEGKRVITSKI